MGVSDFSVLLTMPMKGGPNLGTAFRGPVHAGLHISAIPLAGTERRDWLGEHSREAGLRPVGRMQRADAVAAVWVSFLPKEIPPFAPKNTERSRSGSFYAPTSRLVLIGKE